jgi:hypothetical protein
LKSKTSAPVEPKRTVKRKSKRHHRRTHATR